MDDDNMTDSNVTETDQKVKTESPETAVASPDIIPLQKPSNNGNGTEKNGQKRIKTEPVDGSCKKPRINTPEAPSIVTNKVASDDTDNMSDVEEYYLTVSNLPSDWTYVQIKNYLDKECGHVDEMEMLQQKNSQNCAILLTFQSSEKRKDVFTKLKSKVIQGKKIKVETTETYTQPSQDVSASETTEIVLSRPWSQDFCETDPQGLYGLRPQFLTSLNIIPPLNRMVNVTNFRCDKSELRDVMELAGNVLMCSVVTTYQRFAEVMYSHPLEAVQAISMLNGQMYYGNPLKITMDKTSSDTIVLPKGLANVGLGLGLQGRPIRNIVQQYQRYTNKQSSLINPIVFTKINFSDNDKNNIANPDEDDPEEIQRKINEFINSTPIGNSLNQITTFKVKNIDELLDSHEANSKDGSNRSTPETNISKASLGGSRKSSIGSVSPNQHPLNKNGAGKPNINSIKPLGTTSPNPTPIAPLIRFNQQNAKGVIRPSLLQNPPVPTHKPMPIPTPGHPNYGPGPTNFVNQQRPAQFGPRPMPFIGPPQRPPFGPQPMPPVGFGPAGGLRPRIPPANFGGPRPFIGPNPAAPRPNINPGGRVTVNFSNLPPSTTFPLLCDQLAQCGQVMSVQLTTPGCAVATFGHPSHAERCFQTFNRMNVEGYIIEVKFA